MTVYIEKEKIMTELIHRLNFLMAENGEYDHYTSGFDEAVDRVEDFPTVELTPVVHGRWIYGEDIDVQCSVCGCDALTEGDYRQTKSNYCPNCGAKMDLEE